MIAGDRASDQLALNGYLLPDLAQRGVTPMVETIDADPSDTATTDARPRSSSSSSGLPASPRSSR